MTPTCSDCGRPTATASHPQGRTGAAFGVDGRLCAACYNRRRYWAKAPPVPPCDLCGAADGGRSRDGRQVIRRDAAPFGLEGRLCLECWGELTEERRANRRNAALEVRARRRSPYTPADHDGREQPRPLPTLLVLGGGFTLSDLTHRAACAVILAETRPVFRRRTG